MFARSHSNKSPAFSALGGRENPPEQCRSTSRTRRAFRALAVLPLLGLGVFAPIPAHADSIAVTSSVANVSGTQYQYTYTITGSLTAGDLLAVYFPYATSSSITAGTNGSSTTTTSVLQADSSIPADGEYDILFNSTLSSFSGTYSALFNYSGTAALSTQSFTLYDSSFAPITSGTTQQLRRRRSLQNLPAGFC